MINYSLQFSESLENVLSLFLLESGLWNKCMKFDCMAIFTIISPVERVLTFLVQVTRHILIYLQRKSLFFKLSGNSKAKVSDFFAKEIGEIFFLGCSRYVDK